MKRILPSLLLGLVIFQGLSAQIRIGLVGGIHGANVTEKNSLPGWDTSTKKYYSGISGIQVGVMLEIPVGHRGFYFQPSIVYSSKGRQYYKYNDSAAATSSDTVYYKQTVKLGYIDIPLNMVYKIPLSANRKNSFFISAGPYVSFFYSGNTTNERLMETTDPLYDNEKTPVNVGKGVDKYKTLDLGINAKAGFELGKVVLSAYYSQGLTSFYQADYSATFHHKLFGASLGIWLSSTTPPPPVVKDTDKDGVPDKEDLCPLLPGTEKYHGCPVPDTDKDGVDDEHDSCRSLPGTAKYNGCPIPDSDGDGVNDEQDSCKTVAGSAKYHGCPIPDTDHDGVDDEQDSCRDIAGVAKYHGCPIPDRDGDGVNDEVDRCPDEAGTVENQGCPAIRQEVQEKINYTAKNILFNAGSDKLSASSSGALTDLSALLLAHPNWHLTIDGYTDNSGSPDKNRTLSQKRADAVKAWLVRHGVEERHLTAMGFGQEHPIAGNNTAAGRAANRRVELKVSLEK